MAAAWPMLLRNGGICSNTSDDMVVGSQQKCTCGIVWGKILPGQWDAFEAAFKRALEIRGEAKGLKSQWLLRDQNDPDAGYSISQWESEEDMRAF